MVDATRALLDELMGADRNLGEEERQKPRPKRMFSDPDICKAYICGFCPEEEYARTKYELGTCQYVHDDKLKAQWEALEDSEMARYPFQRDLKRRLEGFMADLDKKLSRNSERLAAQEVPSITAADQESMDLLAQRIAELLVQSEALGEAGDVDAAQAVVAQADTLKAQRSALEREAMTVLAKSAGAAQMVCTFSGVIINVDEARQRDHKSGRNYAAWVKAHKVNKELKEIFLRRDLERLPLPPPMMGNERGRPDEHQSASREGYPSGSRDRDRDRRDRDRGSGRRDRDRDQDGHNDRERERPRGSDRGERPDQRERGRDRGRERSPADRSRHSDSYRRRDRDR